ncbi:hypothetical protein LAJ19_06635 [Deinococcus taeanensis]|uniref:TerC family protein n=1 Tax=Deinococcus taeanensis TaxID=2737050 RepID=UPI001CDB93CB|nr:hypothetical protein LAJ19_06635 [Deinococcus taeanensis]
MGTGETQGEQTSLRGVIIQIPVSDLGCRPDSVMVEIGFSGYIPVMAAAVVLATLNHGRASVPISRSPDAHPPQQRLAVTFLLLVGTSLVSRASGSGGKAHPCTSRSCSQAE